MRWSSGKQLVNTTFIFCVVYSCVLTSLVIFSFNLIRSAFKPVLFEGLDEYQRYQTCGSPSPPLYTIFGTNLWKQNSKFRHLLWQTSLSESIPRPLLPPYYFNVPRAHLNVVLKIFSGFSKFALKTLKIFLNSPFELCAQSMMTSLFHYRGCIMWPIYLPKSKCVVCTPEKPNCLFILLGVIFSSTFCFQTRVTSCLSFESYTLRLKTSQNTRRYWFMFTDTKMNKTLRHHFSFLDKILDFLEKIMVMNLCAMAPCHFYPDDGSSSSKEAFENV
jgi:hypothetical protein